MREYSADGNWNKIDLDIWATMPFCMDASVHHKMNEELFQQFGVKNKEKGW